MSTWSWLFYPIGEKLTRREIRPKLNELRRWRQLSNADRRRLSLQRLHSILNWAGSTVPYYRDLFREIHFNPDQVLRSGEEILKIPYLTKEILREQGPRMLSEKMAPRSLQIRKTNGSTGLTTDIYYDSEFLDWSAAANLLTYDYTGRRMSEREIQLSTRPRSSDRGIDWLGRWKCAALGRTHVHTTNFAEDGLKRLLEDIERSRARQIQGHPSTLYYLSLFAKAKGLKRSPLITAFASTGETLSLEKGKTIEDTLGCKVYNRYGNAEFGVVAHSLDDPQTLEIFDFNVWVENRILGDGRKEIVATGLLNKAMPLIRYQTGDIGELAIRDRKVLLTKIEGRVHDVVTIQGRAYPTHYIKDHLERWGGVDEWQILLRDKAPHLLRIVGAPGINQAKITSLCEKTFGNDYRVEFIRLNELKFTGWRDKFRYVVREIPAPESGLHT